MSTTRPEPSLAQPPLLLADDPALDFLNTRPGLYTDHPDERLSDGEALVSWLTAAGLLSRSEEKAVRQIMSRAQLDRVAADARVLRERLRPAVATWAAKGTVPPASLLAELNRVLSAGPSAVAVGTAGGRIVLTASRRFDSAPAILAPLAEAIARLFAEGDRRLVRECGSEACSLWFYDRTKAHRRRWCSMDACGARAKAAAYRARQREM
jgi:predicted RNA-binding Zn ribbon-like protein